MIKGRVGGRGEKKGDERRFLHSSPQFYLTTRSSRKELNFMRTPLHASIEVTLFLEQQRSLTPIYKVG